MGPLIPLDKLLHLEAGERHTPEPRSRLRREALLAQLDTLDDRIDAAERRGAVPHDLIAQREALIGRIEADE
jgi:hypothetical protein